MKRMKTLFMYAFLLITLFVVCKLLEHGLIWSMYVAIPGNAIANDSITINVEEAKATKANGYMDIQIKNDSNKNIDKYYAKIDLINRYNQNSITEYALIKDLAPGNTYNYKVNFRGDRIEKYNIELVSEAPDKTHIINILGWEIDTTNVFGLGIDLTNVYGVDVTEYFSIGKILDLAEQGVDSGIDIAKSVPVWAYVIAALTVIWYL